LRRDVERQSGLLGDQLVVARRQGRHDVGVQDEVAGRGHQRLPLDLALARLALAGGLSAASAFARCRSTCVRVGPSHCSRLVPAAGAAKGRTAASRPRPEISAIAPTASSWLEPMTPTSDQPSSLAIVTTTGPVPSGTTS